MARPASFSTHEPPATVLVSKVTQSGLAGFVHACPHTVSPLAHSAVWVQESADTVIELICGSHAVVAIPQKAVPQIEEEPRYYTMTFEVPANKSA